MARGLHGGLRGMFCLLLHGLAAPTSRYTRCNDCLLVRYQCSSKRGVRMGFGGFWRETIRDRGSVQAFYSERGVVRLSWGYHVADSCSRHKVGGFEERLVCKLNGMNQKPCFLI